MSGFFLGFVIGHIVRDKGIQETLVKDSGMEYIIARPGRLSDGPKTGVYRIGLDLKSGTITRSDVGHFLLSQLNSNEWLNKTPTLIY